MHLLRELFRRRMSHLLHLHRAFIPWRGCDMTVHSRKEWAVKGEDGGRLWGAPLPQKETSGSSAFGMDQFSEGRAMP